MHGLTEDEELAYWRERAHKAEDDLANERQISEGLRRLIDEVADDIERVTRFRAAMHSGGQHVGTGGALGNATPSALIYLERLVRDARRRLGTGKDKP